MSYVNEKNSFFYNEDCIAGARKHIKDNSIDLIVTDPPYGINGNSLHLHYSRNEDLVVEGYIEVPKIEYREFSLNWIREAERVLKPGGAIYIVSGYTNLYYILDALYSVKLKEVNHIIWKYNFGVFTKKKFVSSHYHILYYEKAGNRKFNIESRYGLDERDINNRSLNYSDREDVWTINRKYKPRKTKNKNELPEELLTKMIQYSSDEGDLICDFFLGGFSTAKVAIGLNRRFIGFEKSESIFNAKIDEIRELEYGNLLPYLRTPVINNPENRGKSWSDNDLILLVQRFDDLISDNHSKKETMEILQEEFKRGYWSIEKILKKRFT